MSGTEEFHAWQIHESGPADAPHTVLLLPGAMLSTAFYDGLMGAPALAGAPVRLAAVTIPGFAGTPAPQDPRMETYAALYGALAAQRGCDAVVGHSLGANIALEMAAGGHFTGPVVLLSPTFSRPDEFKELEVADRLGRVPGIGALAWSAMVHMTPHAMAESLPGDSRDELMAELKKNDPPVCRKIVRHYFDYLDHHGSLVPRLRESGARAWVVRGDRDEIGLTDEEHDELAAMTRVTMVTVPDAGHMVMTDQPARVAELIARVVLD
ncbi:MULTISPECIES: alpha/beta fold hydrolase [unclassified Streptomyces]|uniref:alpha/beta fold hydrolase n=1 Tax=unclassified Streptomyces TaxID=2593676 RepID=UPI00364E7E91